MSYIARLNFAWKFVDFVIVDLFWSVDYYVILYERSRKKIDTKFNRTIERLIIHKEHYSIRVYLKILTFIYKRERSVLKYYLQKWGKGKKNNYLEKRIQR